MKEKSTYRNYIYYRWSVLLPKIVPLLYRNGGPVIMVQIENEYGNVAECDTQYLTALRDLAWKYLGNETVLYSTDNARVDALR